MQNFKVPRWYQELSINQMQQASALEKAIQCDYLEQGCERTQKILKNIGITSAFVKMSSKDAINLQKLSNFDAGRFLCEVYRYITGNYFDEEKYKKMYDCNERLVLSTITFLKLPETIMELHRRLPLGESVKFPPKPLPPQNVYRTSKKSPYLDPVFQLLDWRNYRINLEKWQKKCKTIIRPRVILPPSYLLEKQQYILDIEQVKPTIKSKNKEKHHNRKIRHSIKISEHNFDSPATIVNDKFIDISKEHAGADGKQDVNYEKDEEENENYKEKNRNYEQDNKNDEKVKKNDEEENQNDEKVNKNYDEEKTNYEEEESENYKKQNENDGVKAESNDVKIHKVEKDIKNHLKPELTPENIFNKKYPPGRENLSRRWQEWLKNADDEYKKLEKTANCLLKNVRETSRKVYNPDMCDNCCVCRQTRKFAIKKKSKIPYTLIDSLVVDEDDKKHVIGSLLVNSPPESLPDSWTKLPQIIPSRDEIIKRRVIDGVTINEKGEAKYLISKVVSDTLHFSKKVKQLETPIKNVPPCSCDNKGKRKVDKDEDEDEEILCLEHQKCNAEKYGPCIQCCHNNSRYNIFREFEKIYKEREDKEKEFLKPIDHESCTRRYFLRDDQNAIKENVEEPEKCAKCCDSPQKCKINPFKNILAEIDKEKMLNRPKVMKKSKIKQYKDNIKFSIGGIVQDENTFNNNGSSNDTIDNVCSVTKYFISEVTMHTPITITPESSESDLKSIGLREDYLHHHWSVTQFVPKQKQKEEKQSVQTRFDINYHEKWKQIIDEPFNKEIQELFEKVHALEIFKQLHASKEKTNEKITENIKDSQYLKISRKRTRKKKRKNIQEPIDRQTVNSSVINRSEIVNDIKEKVKVENDNFSHFNVDSNIIKNVLKRNIKMKEGSLSLFDDVSSNIAKDISKEKIEMKKDRFPYFDKTGPNIEDVSKTTISIKKTICSDSNNVSSYIEKDVSKEVQVKKGSLSHFNNASLVVLMKIALEQMAKEGFIFARLPQCYNIPQIQLWIMYRQGFIFTETQKHELLEKSEKMWSLIESKKRERIKAPVVAIRERGSKLFYFDNIKKHQAKIEHRKKIFYSKVRQDRVQHAREMWNQIEFDKFPNLNFKRAYFTYQPSKEADGHLVRPYNFEPS